MYAQRIIEAARVILAKMDPTSLMLQLISEIPMSGFDSLSLTAVHHKTVSVGTASDCPVTNPGESGKLRIAHNEIKALSISSSSTYFVGHIFLFPWSIGTRSTPVRSERLSSKGLSNIVPRASSSDIALYSVDGNGSWDHGVGQPEVQDRQDKGNHATGYHPIASLRCKAKKGT